MPRSAENAKRVREIRSQLDHPVIDGDGHDIEFLPAVKDEVLAIGGAKVLEGFERVIGASKFSRALNVEQRRLLGIPKMPFWGLPARNTLDRATAMLPALLNERLEEFGIDFAVLYPTYGLTAYHLDDEDLRPPLCRAFNKHRSEAYAAYSNRISPVAVIPMHTPQEALDELDYAVCELGMKAILMGAYAQRPLPGENESRSARWLDTFGPESLYDYDAVWAKCEELGVSPTFHSSGMGWGSRNSTSNYVFNHLGNFATAGEAICRSLFMSGVPQRFPKLRFAFLEGGVAWGCNLYADILGHWEKRNRESIEHYNPANLDRGQLEDLFKRYGNPQQVAGIGRMDEALHLLSEPDEDPADIDEFKLAGVDTAVEIKEIFSERYFFGCEADDPMNASAFDTRKNPHNTRLRALFSSDIGHWDVPDMTEVVVEAHELVEDELISAADFRSFVFENAVALWAAPNPGFFAGTAVEQAAQREVERTRARA